MNQDELSITARQLESLEKMKFRYCKDLYYELPIIMYIMKWYMSNLQKEESTESEEEASAYLENCFAVGK